MNKFKNSNSYGRPIHISSLYKFRLPKFNMPAAPLLYSRLSSIEASVLCAKTAKWRFEPPFGELTDNVRTSSIPRWKEHDRLPRGHN